jgi:ABC-type branched-subunit amino acid transport system ATPase component
VSPGTGPGEPDDARFDALDDLTTGAIDEAGRDARRARREERRRRREARNAEIDAELDAERDAKARKRGRLDSNADRDDAPRGPARLEIRDVVVDFGGLRAVDNVSVTVEPGTITGLIGPNGSGKTTLLDTVSGQVTPTEGSLLLDGRDLVDFLPEERAGMGMVRSFQDCRLFPELSVEDTLLLCEDARRQVDVLSTTLQLPWARRSEREKRQAVDRIIGSFGLERFRYHLTGHLSTGTRRVVDLASIILAGPRILLLDEPTAGIAQREAEAFIPLLRRLHEVTGATILIVEHDVPLVFELCSAVVVMQTGVVVASGDPDTVRQDPAALAAYLGASDAALNVTGPVRPAQAEAGGLAGP